MHPVPPSVDQLFSARVLNRVASAEEGSNPLVGTALVSMPWLVAFEGQDTVAYACAVAAEVAGGAVGGKPDSSYALFISSPMILFSSPTLFDSPVCSKPAVQYIRPGSSCQFRIKYSEPRFQHSANSFPAVRLVAYG